MLEMCRLHVIEDPGTVSECVPDVIGYGLLLRLRASVLPRTTYRYVSHVSALSLGSEMLELPTTGKVVGQ